ncbi:MAG: hypothetical protein H0Z33_03540 [Bacillaceae bacterium]|nr:hypothetical protein [Bacillaceae bacterium]
MWTCPYCGSSSGMMYEDRNLKGILCLHPDCGRFDQLDEQRLESEEIRHFYSDL